MKTSNRTTEEPSFEPATNRQDLPKDRHRHLVRRFCAKRQTYRAAHPVVPTDGQQAGIDETGRLWINDQQVEAEHFGDALRAAVGTETEPKVVIRGDARLNFREVRQAMLAIEQAGFRGVGLVAKPAGAKGE